MADAVRGVEEVAVDYEARGRHDPPKLWISLFSFVFCCLCQGKGGQRSTRARGRLSEAKTQRRPHSARESERGGFPLLLFLYLSFEQGKKNT